ncbi:MerR family transcriptional regulator [Clostridium estertheticum]|uniref:MerR family transcriptional regulator n=1 Tax=Clostridium estertheticum TaxID=238834 RepID=UPI001CF5821E|nr:MerR family transcriptional regulator [Clostridium estertheticum]MCB2362209.1 MerR family transcriptional regulator [Clostridium estertheticum]
MLLINIKVVSEKTGLTKRAIKYYESEGLISPLKNNDNNYREYTDNDIVKLNLIGALRIIDIPICEIKSYLEILNEDYKKYTEIDKEIYIGAIDEIKNELSEEIKDKLG